MIQAAALAPYAPAGQNSTTGQGIMGKDDFLKLMMIQMQHQDPLDPIDNSQMLSQMAQFSSLEQMNNLNDNLMQARSITEFMEATRLIGKEVAVRDIASSPDDPQFLQEPVKSVSYTPDGAVLTLANGMFATVDQIVRVSDVEAVPSQEG